VNVSEQKSKPKSKQVGRWLRRGLGLLLVLGLVAATVFALQPKPIAVDLHALARGPLRVTIDEDGQTRVIDRYQVSAPLAGSVGRIRLRPGDPVEQGLLLLTIEPSAPPLLDARTRAEAEARLKATEAGKRQAAAAVAQARTAAEFARAERERIAELVGKGSYAQRNLEVAEFELRSREQQLESATFGQRVAQYEYELARATIRRMDEQASKPTEAADDGGPVVHVHSPITGTVLRVMQENEGVIAPGTPLLELADANALEIVADVLTSDAVRITRGAAVELHGWGGDETLHGHVRLVEPSAFTKLSALGVEEQRVNVIIDLLDHPQLPLGDGYRVEVSIVVWQSDDVLLIPVSALFRRGDGWAVWVVEDGRAHARDVAIGHRYGLQVEALVGVSAGEQVIVHPPDSISEGVEVVSR
jgi:HlyD family secretion protein